MRVAGLCILALLTPTLVFAAQININTASAGALDALKGIGPSKAQAIVDYRSKHGPFKTIEEIQNVSGIGPATFANIKADITVGDATPTPAPISAPQSTPVQNPQPPAPKPSSHQVQEAQPVPPRDPVLTSTTNSTYEQQAVAPTAPPSVAAVGALPEPPTKKSTGLFHSFWTLGLIGVIVLASGAFILL